MGELCKCAEWAKNGNGKANYEHHPNCEHYDPERELIELMKKLIRGIECWAGDEDGVHNECYDAYRQAKFMVEGKVLEP